MSATVSMAKAERRPPAWRSPLVVLLVGVLAWFALPDQLGLITRLATSALLVLSLDLVVGVAGLATLGHAALFGVGVALMAVVMLPPEKMWHWLRARVGARP